MSRFFAIKSFCLAVAFLASGPFAYAGGTSLLPLKKIGPAITPPKVQIPLQRERDSHFQDIASSADVIDAPYVFIKSGIPGTFRSLDSVNMFVCNDGRIVDDVLSRLNVTKYAWNAARQNYELVYSGGPTAGYDGSKGITICPAWDNEENSDPTHPAYVEFQAPEGAFITRRIVENLGIPYWNASAYVELTADSIFRFYCQTKRGESEGFQWDAVPDASSAGIPLDSMPYVRNTAFNADNRPECGPNATLYKAPALRGKTFTVNHGSSSDLPSLLLKP